PDAEFQPAEPGLPAEGDAVQQHRKFSSGAGDDPGDVLAHVVAGSRPDAGDSASGDDADFGRGGHDGHSDSRRAAQGVLHARDPGRGDDDETALALHEPAGHDEAGDSRRAEGNPQVKGKIRRIQRDMLRRNMMREVPKATAIIVNPSHYAVALKYEQGTMAAPRVIAKGKNYLAARIRQKAIENQIPSIENPPLAHALYNSVDVGQEIPAHLYRAVAEILAYIFRLMGNAKR